MPKKKRDEQLDEKQEWELPQGVKLLQVLEGHKGIVHSVAFNPMSPMLASGSRDRTVKLWDVFSGELLHTLDQASVVLSIAFHPTGKILASGGANGAIKLWNAVSGKLLHTLKGWDKGAVLSIAFDPTGKILASGGHDRTLKLWNVVSGKSRRTLKGHKNHVYSVAFDPAGKMLASASGDKAVKLWDVATGKLLHTLEGHKNYVYSVAFDPAGKMLASASGDKAVKLWDIATGKLLHTLEGHTSNVEAVAFSMNGRLLASKSDDGTLRLWKRNSWETLAIILEPTHLSYWIPGLSFHPTLSLLAAVGSKLDALEYERSRLIHFWELDLDVLLGKVSEAEPALEAVHHTTAKIVLVGDHSVGKSGLGWRLAHGEFKEQSSTHGQQFWVLPQLGKLRDDGTECEAILWDLAGQPDYRLIHALFLDDVDLALVLFDSSDINDPLHGVEFWLKQLQVGQTFQHSESDNRRVGCPTILVGAQADRGTPSLTPEDLETFCRQRGVSGYLSTSAKEGWGLDELTRLMKKLVAWDDKPSTVTTITFKRIKDYLLKLKENRRRKKVLVSPTELRQQLEQTDANWQFTDAEMATAVGHLENYGYARWLRTSMGEERVLLAPEVLNNLAASFVLEARRNLKGLGSLEEGRLIEGGYSFPGLGKLSAGERDILLDAAALLFLEHNVCFREIDPLGGKSYLVFPELINLKKPVLEAEQAMKDGVAYTVSGAIENVYASLVVLLGYTQTFTRTNQWQRQARYVMGDGSICGFRQEGEPDGELEFVLYFSARVPQPGQKVFEGLFESFLARRNLTVFRYEPVICGKCKHVLERTVVRARARTGKSFTFCTECGKKLALPKADEPIQLTQTERHKVDEQRWFADQRNRFERAIFHVMSYVKNLEVPECFISYAWGDNERERWVERNLASDLQKAGVQVVLDRWENDRAGKSVSRFASRIAKSDYVIPVGTPLYFEKFENKVLSAGSVVASEVDLISQRLIGTETEKETVMPILLAGEQKSSLPPLMWDRVYYDFRNERAYFITAFDLILNLYGIAPKNTAVADLRESLREFEMR